jgi:mannosyltransferase OCH1-like enzyme
MHDKAIFSFWEPRGNLPPYLELCLKTWERNLPDHEIVVLNHSNMDAYLGGGT